MSVPLDRSSLSFVPTTATRSARDASPLRLFRSLFFLVLLCLFFILAGCGSRGFPEIASGSYTGEISSVVKGSQQTFSFYAERLGSDSSMLFVVFAEGWSPQVVTASAPNEGEKEKKKGPVRLTAEGQYYVLTGGPSGDGYSGEVETADGRRGKWTLNPVPAQFKQDRSLQIANFDPKEWIAVKSRFNMVRDELSSLKLSFEQEMSKHEKLERFVKDEDVLRDRSRSRKDALATELNRITEQRKKSTQDLKDALGGLSMLHKYTKEGQAIELNRKIARRENKWYSINWASGGSAENVEEELAAQEQIDLKKLNAAVKRAEEVHRLQVEAEQEQEKIRELETALQRRIRVIQPEQEPAAPRGNPPVEPDEKKPWWRLWESAG